MTTCNCHGGPNCCMLRPYWTLWTPERLPTVDNGKWPQTDDRDRNFGAAAVPVERGEE